MQNSLSPEPRNYTRKLANLDLEISEEVLNAMTSAQLQELRFEKLKKKSEERRKKRASQEDNLPKIFIVAWERMSKESKVALTFDADYRQRMKDPVLLSEIIKRTHLTGSANTVDGGKHILEQQIRLQAFNNIVQREKETLVDFKERFEDEIQSMKLTGGDRHVSDVRAMAVEFMMRLDKARYGKFFADFSNQVTNTGICFGTPRGTLLGVQTTPGGVLTTPRGDNHPYVTPPWGTYHPLGTPSILSAFCLGYLWGKFYPRGT